jgi:hypothetical protein
VLLDTNGLGAEASVEGLTVVKGASDATMNESAALGESVARRHLGRDR